MGDGTTSVVVLAGEILREIRDSVEQGVSAQTIIKGLRSASAMAVNRIKEISIDMKDAAGGDAKKVETLRRLAGTAMNSKLIKRNSEFFTKSKGIILAFTIFDHLWKKIYRHMLTYICSGRGCGSIFGPR